MTKQLDEVISLDGMTLPLLTRPLSGWLLETSFRFDQHRNITMARGYRGSWSIYSDKLYLIALQGYLRDGGLVNMGDLFPHSHGQPVLADWFDGELRVPRGDAVQSSDVFNPVVYPWEIRFTVLEGTIIDRKMVKNNITIMKHIQTQTKTPWWRKL